MIPTEKEFIISAIFWGSEIVSVALLNSLLIHWVTDNQNVLFLGISTFVDENTIMPQNSVIRLPNDAT